MAFFVVEPEASGRPDGRGAPGGEVSCTFDTWLGDDLVRAHPLLLVTAPLKKALEALKAPRGFSLAPARATTSAFFQSHDPGRRLPSFWSLEVKGRPAVDDMGMAGDGSLVASARVVRVMGRFTLKHATFSQYVPATENRAAQTVAT